MTHTCEYCDKQIQPCGKSCKLASNKDHVCCTCDIDESKCEVEAKVICDGPLCNFKFQVYYLESKLDSLKLSQADEMEKLKELSNSNRLMGITPKALELLIQIEGAKLPGIFINKNERFTWDKMSPEDLATVGLMCMSNFDKLTKIWSQFLNEKAVKPSIKKELLEKSARDLKDAQDLRDGKTKIASNGQVKPVKPKKVSLKDLNEYERLVYHSAKNLGLTQEQAEQSVQAMGMTGECRNLKELGFI